MKQGPYTVTTFLKTERNIRDGIESLLNNGWRIEYIEKITGDELYSFKVYASKECPPEPEKKKYDEEETALCEY